MRQARGFLGSSIGRKVVMAVTGAILFGFVLVHMIGNLQVYLGPRGHERLRRLPARAPPRHGPLDRPRPCCSPPSSCTSGRRRRSRWTSRARAARSATGSRSGRSPRTPPGRCAGAASSSSSSSSTTCSTSRSGRCTRASSRATCTTTSSPGFRSVPVSIFYIVAMILLGLHLRHGLWSMCQTLGVSHPRYMRLAHVGAWIFAAIIVIGNISFPLAVLAGIVK